MSFIIDTEEIMGMDVIKEVFSFEANISIRVQIFGRVFKNGIELLFMLLKFIMEDRREDFPFALLGREIMGA